MGKSKIDLIKHSFFNKSSPQKITFSFRDDSFNLNQLHNEFSSLYQLFLSNKKYWAKNIEIASYMSYLCDLMICYYEYDYVGFELHQLKKKKKEIDGYLQENHIIIDKFPIFLLEKLKTNLQEYQSVFSSISTFRAKIGKLNTNRSRFGYSRNLATFFINYLQHSSVSDFIHEINVILGNQYNFIDGINLLNQSREIITILGIILYALRFLLHLILMIKHVIHAAISEELSTKKVLMQELQKRGFTMASDLVWSLVGLVTTYNDFFHLPTSALSPLILCFLTFDALLLLAQWVFEATEYNKRLEEFLSQQKDATFIEHLVIQRQIDLLNDEWEVQCAYYAINILGANILATSFAIAMLCTGPLALAGMAFCSMLGNALYNTSEEYKKYQHAKTAVHRERCNGMILNDEHHQTLIKLLQEECDQNYIQFWKDLAFNVGGIAFIITAAVTSWPIALSVTIVYVAYQLNNSYQKQRAKNNTHEIPHDIYRLFPSKVEPEEHLALEYSTTQSNDIDYKTS